MKQKKIGVLMGGLSSEREVSLNSGKAVLASLLRSGYNAVGIDVDRELSGKLVAQKVDIAFNVLHGRWGEDGTVQGLLEILGIPYTGSGVMGSALAIDKCCSKLTMAGLGIPTPGYRICCADEYINFSLPFVVKPAREGSSVGISVVRRKEQMDDAIAAALQHDSKVLLEEFIEGREITVGIVNNTALPIVEVRPKSGFYDYTSKYTKGMTEYLAPATLDSATEQKAVRIALSVWQHFDLAGCARIDMMLGTAGPMVIDINTSPGMTETSLIPKAWAALGKTFDQLVEEILKGAGLKI